MIIEEHPECSVFIVGSNQVRTRLYRIGITKNLLEISSGFEIFGLVNSVWEEFGTKKDYKPKIPL